MGEAELRQNCDQFTLNFNQMTSFSMFRKGGSHEPFHDVEEGKFWVKESDYGSFNQTQLQGAGKRKNRRRQPDFLVYESTSKIIVQENRGNK